MSPIRRRRAAVSPDRTHAHLDRITSLLNETAVNVAEARNVTRQLGELLRQVALAELQQRQEDEQP